VVIRWPVLQPSVESGHGKHAEIADWHRVHRAVGDRRDAKYGGGGRRRHSGHWRRDRGPRSLRSELNNYVNAYRVAEHISAVSLAVTFRGRRPAINLAAGSTRYGGGPAISPYALWQIGSNTKAFTSVLVLQLEAEHKLSINDTLGKWLPQYPSWAGGTCSILVLITGGRLPLACRPAIGLSRYFPR
jgi:Beta-lactamase